MTKDRKMIRRFLQGGLFLVLFMLVMAGGGPVWAAASALGAPAAVVDAGSIVDKVVSGYQGWSGMIGSNGAER